jgi:hypothetical protein
MEMPNSKKREGQQVPLKEKAFQKNKKSKVNYFLLDK